MARLGLDKEGIYCAMRALVSPFDHLVVVTPCYQSLLTLPQVINAEVTTVALNPHKSWQLTLGLFYKLLLEFVHEEIFRFVCSGALMRIHQNSPTQ